MDGQWRIRTGKIIWKFSAPNFSSYSSDDSSDYEEEEESDYSEEEEEEEEEESLSEEGLSPKNLNKDLLRQIRDKRSK